MNTRLKKLNGKRKYKSNFSEARTSVINFLPQIKYEYCYFQLHSMLTQCSLAPGKSMPSHVLLVMLILHDIETVLNEYVLTQIWDS